MYTCIYICQWSWITHIWSTFFFFFFSLKAEAPVGNINYIRMCWVDLFTMKLSVLSGALRNRRLHSWSRWSTDTLLLGPYVLAEPMTPKMSVVTGDVVCSPWPFSKEDSSGFGNKFFPPPAADLLQFLSQKVNTWLRCTQWTFDLNCPFDPKHHKVGFS